MKEYTDITILLDRSGSMNSIKEPMEKAFDEFIQGHKINPTTKLTLIQFDSTNPQEIIYQGVPVGSVERLILQPRGMTPLVDAMVSAIDNTGSRLANMRESDRPDQVLMVIITDGAENASTHYKRADVAKRISKQTNDYKWQFIYLGANQDAIGEAATFGISPSFALNYQANVNAVDSAWHATVTNTVGYATNSSSLRGKGDSLKFSQEQRKKAEVKS